MTRVYDLQKDAYVLEYSLPPEKAVVCAFEQSRGNHNTWTYNFNQAKKCPNFGTWVCGHFAAR